MWQNAKLTLKSPRAVPASVDHLERQASPEPTVATAIQAGTEIREDRAKMLPRKKNCCQFHLSASAWLSLDHQDPRDPRDRTDRPENLDAPEATARTDLKDHLDRLAQLAAMDKTARQVHVEKMAA